MKKRIVVGFAYVENVYGGPEEGGWYYDRGTPEPQGQKVFFNKEKAKHYAEHLESLLERREKFAGVGVGGCGDDDGMFSGEATHGGIAVEVQIFPKKSRKMLQGWPTERPYYC